jgi:hypothetical protein
VLYTPCQHTISGEVLWEGCWVYLGFEFLEFFFLLFPVFVDFALGFCSGFFYAFCAVCIESVPSDSGKGEVVSVLSIMTGEEDVHSLAITHFGQYTLKCIKGGRDSPC